MGPFAPQGETPSLDTNPAGTLMWDSQPPNCEKTNACCLSQPVSGVLFWRPKLTKKSQRPAYDIGHYHFLLPGGVCVCVLGRRGRRGRLSLPPCRAGPWADLENNCHKDLAKHLWPGQGWGASPPPPPLLGAGVGGQMEEPPCGEGSY